MENISFKLRPSPWIVQQVNNYNLNNKINILDFASGTGRHSINLAGKNRIITAIDWDKSKLDLYKNLKHIKTIDFDLEDNNKWPLEKEAFDIIIVSNYLYRPKIKKLTNLLKNDGLLLYETFAVGNEKFGRPSNPKYLLNHRELIELFKSKFKILYYFHGKITQNQTSIIQRCSLKKKAPCSKRPLINNI